MKNPNISVVSNIYPVKTKRDYVDIEGNEAYFQQISDLRALKTACDSCCCRCDSCRVIDDTSEKPWGRVRINGSLVDICKCQRKSCELFYKECRPELRGTNANQRRN